MKRILLPASKTILLIILLATSLSSFAETPPSGWQAKFQTQKVFIENKGQFNNLNRLPGSKILFGTEYANAQFLFTKEGLTYRLTKKEFPDAEEREEREHEVKERIKKGEKITHQEMEKEEHRIQMEIETVHMNWVNANPQVQILAVDAVDNYFNFGMGSSSIDRVKGYKKIIYKSLYPNIDVEYIFHPDNGIEYSFTLHPGADASQIKMKYSGADQVTLDAKNNIHLKTELGDIIDHAPQSFFAVNKKEIIASQFIRNGNTVSFLLGNYDHNQEVIIDPWTQTPNFNTVWDCVWECEKDAAGNAYIIGGIMPLQLIKYDAAGILQWTYTTTYDTSNTWLGTLATDNAGNSYVTEGTGTGIIKVGTGGNLIYNNPNATGGLATEFWTISFNCDQTKLIVGGTGGALAPYIYELDMTTGNSIHSLQVTGTKIIPGTQEVRSLTACGNGKYYFLTHDSIGFINQNFSICSNPANAKHYIDNGYHFGYKCEDFRADNTGICALRSFGGFVFSCRGNQIDKRNLTTGAVLASATIPSGAFSTVLGSIQIQNSGIDIDNCGNIYVGSKNQIVKFDQNLTQLATYPTSFNVYDVHVSANGNIIACGTTGNSGSGARTGYVQSIAVSACAPIALTCCDASICGSPTVCTSASPFNLTASTSGGVWSGAGITNPTVGTFSPSAAGLGVHYVKNTIACGSDSVPILVSPCLPLSVCVQNNGQLTVSNGVAVYKWDQEVQQQDCSLCAPAIPPFIQPCSFPPGCATTVNVWQQFSTGSTVTPPGTYPLRVTDEAGYDTILVSLASIPSCTGCTLAANATSTNTTCGSNNGSVTATPNGGTNTYLWNNGLTTQTLSNVAAGNYTVTVTGGGCSVTASATVGSSSSISATASATAAGCANTGTATANITGGTAIGYLWNNAGTTATISNLPTGTYTVTVTASGNCTATASAVVSSSGSNVAITASATSAGCAPTGTATANITSGSGPFAYNWSSGASSQTATNLSAGTYTVTVTGAGSCTASASATVGSSGSGVVLSPSSINATCGNSNGTASISVTTGTAPFTYLWSNGGTTSSILNVPNGTYIVTVTGAGNCSATASVTVSATNGVTINTTSNNAGCATGGSATVNTTSGTAPFSYLWSNGATTQTASSLAAGTYTITVTGSGNCTATASVTIASSGGITLTPAATSTTCGNSNGAASVTATGGTGNYTYIWNAGGTSSSISNLPAGTYTVTVNDNAGCSSTASAIVNPSGSGSVNISSTRNIMCAGDSIQICTDILYTSYLWNNGGTGQCIYAKNAGNYYVTTTDNGNCTANSNHLTINVYPLPAVSISVNGDTMTAFNASAYQWYFNGTAIPNATSNVHVATQSGSYTVAVSDANGCVAFSNPVNITTVGLHEIAEGPGLKVYPNPLDAGFWTLECGTNMLGGTAEIFDDNGRLVYQTQIRNVKSEIEFNAAGGVYMLRLFSPKYTATLKLIKL